MARFLFADVWSAPECDAGVALASLPAISKLVRHQSVTADDYITLTLPLGAEGADALEHQRIVRLTYDDGTVSEWRISEDTVGVDSSGETLTVRADTLLLDLADRDLILSPDAAGTPMWGEAFVALTPAEYLALILARLHAHGRLTWVTAGPCDRSGRLDLAWSDATALKVARQVADHPLVSGELAWVRDGAVGYRLGIVDAIGADAEVVEVLAGKNLRSYRRSRTSVDLATAIVGRGMVDASGKEATVATAVIRVAAISGSKIRVEDPADPTARMLPFDGMLDGCRVLRPDNPTLHATVTATDALTQELTLSSATGFSVGALTELRAGDGSALVELTNPVAALAPPLGYGRKVALYTKSDARGERNYLRNAFCRDWPTPASAGPVGTTYLGGYFARAVDAAAPAGAVALLREARWGQVDGSNPIAAGATAFRANGGSGPRLLPGDVITFDPHGIAGAPFQVTITGVTYDLAGGGGGAPLLFSCTPTARAAASPQFYYLPNSSGMGTGGSPGASGILARYQFTDIRLPPGVTTVSVAVEVYAVAFYTPDSLDPMSSEAAAVRLVVQVVRLSDSTPINTHTVYAQAPRAWQVLSVTGVAVPPTGHVLRVRVEAQDRDTFYRGGGNPSPSGLYEIPALRWAYVGAGSELPPHVLGSDFQVPEHSHGNHLWHAVTRELARRSAPSATYDLGVVDLTRVAGGALRDVLTVGQTLLVESPAAGQGATPPTDLDTEPLRVTSLTVDELDPAGTTLTVDPIARTLTGVLSRTAL